MWHPIHEVREQLGLTQHWAIVIAGVGNLGQALAHYRGFTERGFRVAALVDTDPAKVGIRIEGLEVRDLDDLPALVHGEAIAIGVIATPATAAQDVAERMVEAGLRSILNFAPAVVTVPEHVTVRKAISRSSCRSWRTTSSGARRRARSARDREPDQERDDDDHDREQDELHRALIEQRHVGEQMQHRPSS